MKESKSIENYIENITYLQEALEREEKELLSLFENWKQIL